MKQFTFNFLKRQLFLIMAVIGFSTSMLANTDVTYTEPTFTADENKQFDDPKFKDSYVQSIELKKGDVTKNWNYQAPRTFWNVLENMTMDAKAGETISAHFIANSLGDYNESTVYQDLRFTAVVLAIDWNGDGTFEYAELIKGKTPPVHFKGGNAMNSQEQLNASQASPKPTTFDPDWYVMDYIYDIVVPEDVTPGTKARVRFNYTNAWFGNKTANDFVDTCKEGIVYDFDLNITEDAPAETWTEIKFKSLSANSSKEAEKELNAEDILKSGTWRAQQFGASAALGGGQNCWGPNEQKPLKGDFLAIKTEIAKEGTYRMSFLHKLALGTSKAELRYTTNFSEWTTVADATIIPEKKSTETGDAFISNNFNLTPGEYYFAYYITEDASEAKAQLRIADFKLEMLEGGVEPTTPAITVKKPTNGNLVISYTENNELKSIETYTFENESEVYNIAEGTVLNISANADFGYVLDKLLPEGMTEKIGMTGDKYYEYTVTDNATIEAIFKAVQYGKVSVEKPAEEEGSIEIQLRDPMRGNWVTADEFFLEQVEFDTELRAKVEAKAGYGIVSVMKNQETLTANTEDGCYYFTVDNENIIISATFQDESEGKYYTVNITSPDAKEGTLKVEMTDNDGKVQNVTNGARVKENTVLTITATANSGYKLKKVVVNGKPVAPKLVDGKPVYQTTVTADTQISVEFSEVSYEINWNGEGPDNGTLKVYKTSDLENPLAKGTKVVAGTELKVVAEANEGYELSRVYYKFYPNGSEVDIENGENGYVFTVSADTENPNNTIIYIYADIKAKTFTLRKVITPEEGGTLSVKVSSLEAGETVNYGDILTVTAKSNSGYLLEDVVVTGADMIDGQINKYKVTGDVTVTATFKKDLSSINNVENGLVYYNANEKVLYTGTAKSVRVYDLSGRLVINAENQETVNLAELAEGIYTAVVDGKVIKLNK